MRLGGRTAVITGGGRGIGRAIALAFAHEGAAIVVNYAHTAAGAQEAVAAITAAGGRAWAIQADVTQPAAVQRLVEEARETLGVVDIWVNNAGASANTTDTPGQSLEERWQRLMDVDLKGTLWCCHAIGPVMRAQPNGGAIINLAWNHALDGAPGVVAQLYAAAKGGVLALSRCLARDLAPEVRVNVIAPGWVENDWARARPAAFRERIARETPLRRWGQPADVAAAAVFLASPEAAFITGQTLVVDGGVVMR